MEDRWRCSECGSLQSRQRHWCANCSEPRPRDEEEEQEERQVWAEARTDYLIQKEWL